MQTFKQEKEERARDLKTIEMYRNMSKKEGIMNMLNQAITVEHTIHPSLGAAEFFEFKFKNPYNVEHTMIIDVPDPELRYVKYPCNSAIDRLAILQRFKEALQ